MIKIPLYILTTYDSYVGILTPNITISENATITPDPSIPQNFITQMLNTPLLLYLEILEPTQLL
jgi:hypothetical protein